jgi:osmotically inducible lipoprotein OsmB
MNMKKLIAVTFLAAGLGACQTSDPVAERAAGGAVLGAGAGAIIGGVATGSARGALTGAAIGGVGGALVGTATADPRGRRICRGYDRYGDPIRYRCR